MPFRRLTSIASILLIAALMTACGGQVEVRTAQIPVRADLRLCAALEALAPEDFPAVASNPSFANLFERAGIVAPPAALALVEQAAGDHARGVQIQERALTVRRDVAQTNIGRENCNRQGELVSLIDENNRGPE